MHRGHSTYLGLTIFPPEVGGTLTVIFKNSLFKTKFLCQGISMPLNYEDALKIGITESVSH